MSDKERTLMYLERAMEALKYAQHHIKHDKWHKADKDAQWVYLYMEKAFPRCESNCHDHCGSCRCCCHDHCCDCHCHHPHHPTHISSKKFFAKVSGGTQTGSTLIIPASSFVNDSGDPVVSFPSTYEYATLYVNGMIQQNGVFTVTPSAIVITGGAQLNTDDPIAVELVIQG